jgi:voltage-gated potassium channel
VIHPPSRISRKNLPHPMAFARAGLTHFSVVEFLVVLVLWIISSAFIEELKNGDLINSVLFTLVLFSAVLAVGARRKVLIVGVVLVAPAIAGKWLNHFRPDIMPPEPFTIAAILCIVFVAVQLLRFILEAPRVNFEVLCGGIAEFLWLGLLWGMVYILMARVTPDAFASATLRDFNLSRHPFSALYFSFVTLSTVGYGDITPVSNGARVLAILESTTGMLYVGVLIARLVALHTYEISSGHTDDSSNA